MEFIASRGLRLSALAEFTVICVAHSAGAVLLRAARGAAEEAGVASCVSLFAAFLGGPVAIALMLPVLYFLRQDTNPCGDAALSAAFWVTVAVFVAAGSRTLLKLWRTVLPRAADGTESPEGPFVFMVEMSSAWLSESRLVLSAVQKEIGWVLIMSFYVLWLALFFFFSVTVFKVALSRGYSTACRVTSTASRALLFGVPCTALVARIIDTGLEICCFLRYASATRALDESEQSEAAEENLPTSTHVFLAAFTIALLLRLVLFALWIILIARAATVWRGAGLDVYEFFALAAWLPAFL